MKPILSIVIPTLNAKNSLQATLDRLNEETISWTSEIIVVDGGSKDGTTTIVTQNDCHLVRSPPGRGCQLGKGAEEAQGEWLLFLHADTLLSDNWQQSVSDFIQRKEAEHQAAVFQYALNAEGKKARRIEKIVAWRCRLLALPYGDQGLLIHRCLYDTLGGYRAIPLMEDVDLIRRIGRKRIHFLSARATTSAIRYERGGFTMRPLLHIVCLILFFIGVSPEIISKIYHRQDQTSAASSISGS
ncbi:MAG: TIGR04283 family arsenosugar biosynthesis glycosyltransferase [Magnetococcales bacterium]|nr:TIGR04283 family arsenosugar biosynthesis glycosyltransferase [Magnetococcales bacterium]